MIETIRWGLQADGITVLISKLCRWFEALRRTVYYRPMKAEPKVQARLAEPIKAMIEESPRWADRFASGTSASGRSFKPCRR